MTKSQGIDTRIKVVRVHTHIFRRWYAPNSPRSSRVGKKSAFSTKAAATLPLPQPWSRTLTSPHIRLKAGSTYNDLVARFGRFPAVVSLEVAEHVYAPRDYARTLFDLVEPGGMALVSTLHHGY